MGLIDSLESKLKELDKKYGELEDDEDLDDDDEQTQKEPTSQNQTSGNTYDQELENLIEFALADGELTDKEKHVLFKKAQSKGIDLDEFEMVLNARIYKMKQQQNPPQTAPKSNKHGEIKKCPACGALVQSYQGVCNVCGYAFENIEANASVQKLSEKLAKAGKRRFFYDEYKKMASIISQFPIPATKSDIIELIMLIQTQLSSLEGREADEVDVYRNACTAKLQECSLKAKLMFPNDPMLQNILNKTGKINTEAEKNRKRHNAMRVIIGTICLLIGIAGGLYLGYKIWEWGSDWKTVWRVLAAIYGGFVPVSIGLIPFLSIKKL